MNLMITLEEDSQALEEVVVVGYGINVKRSLTGAVAGLSADSSTPASAPLEKLEEQDKETKDEVDAGQIYNELMQLSGLRRNFSDVAFWQPRLLTDKTGTVRFETTFPDNMTKWEAVVYAMNRRLQTGHFPPFRPLLQAVDGGTENSPFPDRWRPKCIGRNDS